MRPLRLGVNIDHVATVRNARGINHPDPVRAALIVQQTQADGITIHLREDRRHISDDDVARIKSSISLPLNLEMAATEEMLAIALRTQPHAVCLVPEKRQEITTEGGLDIVALQSKLHPFIKRLHSADIRVSLFIEPDSKQIQSAFEVGADIVELHTGKYCSSSGLTLQAEWERIAAAAALADKIGLECHAGHGISYATVEPIAAIEQIVELNIGHFLIGEAIFIGLSESISQMKKLMNQTRGLGI